MRTTTASALPDTGVRLQTLPRRTYRFRVLGMGLASLPVAMVLHETDAHWLAWAWVVFGCLLWPHLAYFTALRSRDPFQAELRNFMIDSILAGSWVPIIQFNLLPSAVLLTVVTADKVNSGIRDLWLRSLPGMLAALLLVGVFTGFQMRIETSMAVLLASLPILVIHTLAVSLSSYRLVRRLQRQNLQLEELSRIDALTGLDARRHWQLRAEDLLKRHQVAGEPACLLLLDVDHFKGINDAFGHAVGDDVLCAIAAAIRGELPAEGFAGRLGGDEFVVAAPFAAARAEGLAERLRVAVNQLNLTQYKALHCSVSIGIASPPAAGLGFREWLEAADRALYRAKRAGRNQSAGLEPVTSATDLPDA